MILMVEIWNGSIIRFTYYGVILKKKRSSQKLEKHNPLQSIFKRSHHGSTVEDYQ